MFNGEEETFLDSALKPLAFNSRFDSQMIKLDDESHKDALFYKLNDSSCLPEGHEHHNLLSYYSYSLSESDKRTPYDTIEGGDLKDINKLMYWLNHSQV